VRAALSWDILAMQAETCLVQPFQEYFRALDSCLTQNNVIITSFLLTENFTWTSRGEQQKYQVARAGKLQVRI
jgi:hypothetical protein